MSDHGLQNGGSTPRGGDQDLSTLDELGLLRLQASVIEELKNRGIVRTRNNPVGDYTEWLVSTTLELELANNSAAGYDATASDGTRYQIKGRRVTPDSPSRQLSAIRNLDAKDFDVLIAVIFDADYKVVEAIEIPHEIVGKYASYRKHVNAHVRGDLLADDRVRRIPELCL